MLDSPAVVFEEVKMPELEIQPNPLPKKSHWHNRKRLNRKVKLIPGRTREYRKITRAIDTRKGSISENTFMPMNNVVNEIRIVQETKESDTHYLIRNLPPLLTQKYFSNPLRVLKKLSLRINKI